MATASYSNQAPALDARFLRRVHLTSLVMTLLFAALTALYVAPAWGAGLLAGGVWSTLNLWVLERLLRAALRPSGRDVVTIAVAGVVKLPVLYGLLVMMFLRGGFPATAMAVGLSMPLAVVVLKVLGRMVATRTSSPSLATRAASTSHPRS